MIEKFLDLIFPKLCLNCKKQGEGYICSSCFKYLNLDFNIKKIKNRPYELLVYLSRYESDMRTKMLKFKFGDSPYIAEYFIEILVKNDKIIKLLKEFDLIIPVPMFIKKKLSRGYNQTELLAKNLSKNIEIPYDISILKRVSEGKTQSTLHRLERLNNIERVFEVEQNINGKKVILLDDIFTTGATVEVCSKILKKSGAKEICVLTICRT